MTVLIAAAVLDAALALAGILFTVRRRLPAQPDELCRIGETKMTLVLGALMALLSVFMLYSKFNDASVAGTGADSWVFVGALSVLCMAGAAFTLPFTLVKTVVAFPDHALYRSVLGEEKTISWKQVAGMKSGMLSKSLKITAADGTVITVNGDTAQYKKFVAAIKDLVRPAAGRELLENLESRMRF